MSNAKPHRPTLPAAHVMPEVCPAHTPRLLSQPRRLRGQGTGSTGIAGRLTLDALLHAAEYVAHLRRPAGGERGDQNAQTDGTTESAAARSDPGHGGEPGGGQATPRPLGGATLSLAPTRARRR